jgi:glycerophosphoryl diester phosphodiesterase
VRDRFGEAWDHLFHPPIAHRGLWSPDGPPENSLSAFQAACAAGYGIELDVQLSADGEAVVFHDDKMQRMTGRPGRVRDHSAADLAAMRLAGTDEKVSTLLETLALVGHRAMVHVEIKTPPGEVGPLERRVHEVIADHNGPLCVIGFNPYSHAWFADHYPGVLRGLDSYSYDDKAQMPEALRQASRTTTTPTCPRRCGSRSVSWSTWRSPGRTSWRWGSTCCRANGPPSCAKAACRWSPGPSASRRSGRR